MDNVVSGFSCLARRATAFVAGGVFIVAGYSPAAEPEAELPVVLTEVSGAAGIEFVETIGDLELSNIVEATGVGCGFLDYDADGWMDLYLVNGKWLEGLSDPGIDPQVRRANATATDRLYRNRGDGTFEDVTAAAGLTRSGYGMAVVAADFDGDGDCDIYVTNYGPNFLFVNHGDGTFTEEAKVRGVADPAFSVGAVFLDYDRDGRLDLYVGNYVTYEPDEGRQHTPAGVHSPLAYEGQQDRLYRGQADGTFADVTAQAGVAIRPVGRAMGVGTIDYDDDGLVDVFVSNDAMENFLLRNQGDGTFVNEALFSGAAFGEAGDAAAAMAVEVADYDVDGRLDMLIPDMNRCCLYHNLGDGMFEDVATRAGLSRVVSGRHSWAGVFADFDLDGCLDVYLANGSACLLEAQHDCLLTGDGRGRFTSVLSSSGSPVSNLSRKFVGRGAARGDYDNDGDLDLLVNNLNAHPLLLRNDTPRRGRHWLMINLVGKPPNRDALGAVVRCRVGDRTVVLPRASAGSYLSQHDSRLHLGLGSHASVKLIEVIWPDGSRQVEQDVLADQVVTIRQGLIRDVLPEEAQPGRARSGGAAAGQTLNRKSEVGQAAARNGD